MTVYNRVNKINKLVKEELLKEKKINEELLLKEREKKSLEMLKVKVNNLEYELEQQLIRIEEVKKERERDLLIAEQKELHKRQVEAWNRSNTAEVYRRRGEYMREMEEENKWRYRP